MRLITNNPRKIAGLKGYELEVVERVPLLIEATAYNSSYLATKAEKLGHLFLQTYLVTLAIRWQATADTVTERYDRLQKLRYLAKVHDLLLQEEVRPVAKALFGNSALIVHLGFDQPLLGNPDWYHSPEHPYTRAIAKILDSLAALPNLQKLEFIVSPGTDPLTGLQVQLDRQIFSSNQKPSTLVDTLQTQTIYSFTTDLDVERSR
jgi:3,4-dihydroxy 2-butanone 4-phosphate synthase/GTP cyclohydrolase II